MPTPATLVSTTVLKSVPLFASFPDEQLRVLASVVTRRSVPRGSVVMAAGDQLDSLYIVISGRLKVMMGDADGKEVILSLIGPGEFFGEMGLIDESPRSASVVSTEPCELIGLAKRDFRRCLAENFEMAMTVMKGLVRRLREADRKIGSLALLDVYGRVARALLEFAQTDREGLMTIRERISRQDIAKMVGASREMVSRVMKDLEDRGFIETREDGSMLVKDRLTTLG